ncbi:DsrE family protein [Lentibacter sp. XHP0401]|uniref:DsrE family protein n=1 Tax=Lentibacter sp. XHP0401 TaxID=2984334 RepID=UPI0021E78D1F|nr:DsrE family protein [Lentibacter sp. XHP0401]MCV2892683.1 DsrE family protein [Lentibacter sp. XHP0401]
MKKILVPALFAASFAMPALADDTPENLVSVVTAAEPQTQLMSMVLTSQAMAQGHAAHILLCGPAGDIALKEAPETATAPQPPMGASPQGLLKAAMEKGAKVEVCAIYLPGKGADASVLIDGVTVAKPPAMAGAMAADDTIVWSF